MCYHCLCTVQFYCQIILFLWLPSLDQQIREHSAIGQHDTAHAILHFSSSIFEFFGVLVILGNVLPMVVISVWFLLIFILFFFIFWIFRSIGGFGQCIANGGNICLVSFYFHTFLLHFLNFSEYWWFWAMYCQWWQYLSATNRDRGPVYCVNGSDWSRTMMMMKTFLLILFPL